jgi:hypothetical protein
VANRVAIPFLLILALLCAFLKFQYAVETHLYGIGFVIVGVLAVLAVLWLLFRRK